MRVPRFLPLLLIALAGFAVQAQAAPMGADDARHLLLRSGFAPTETEVQQFAALSREEAADRLLRGTRKQAQNVAPEWVNEPYERPRVREMSDEERKQYQRDLAAKSNELRAWWMGEMLSTPSPLTERMTLFWHNHFVSGTQKVRVPQAMYRQNVLLRYHALANFGAMLHEVAKDPAMMIYLDSATNRKGAPNENFAREVMELFTLGEGKYSEQDIKEAARAYTGWSLEPQSAEYVWRPRQHDEGVKTVLGRTGNFDGDQVLDILLAQPAAAEFITRKLWMEFVSRDADAAADRAEIGRIASQFRNSRYEIKVALKGIFTSPRFYAPENRATLIKSPVELVVGAVRQMGVGYGDPLLFAFSSATLGQNLMAPPNVRGWPGGETWINSTTLLARKQFAERLLRVEVTREVPGGMAPPAAMNMGMEPPRRADGVAVQGMARLGAEGRERLARAGAGVQFDSHKYVAQFARSDDLVKALLPGRPANPLPDDLAGPALLKALMLDPMYQLK